MKKFKNSETEIQNIDDSKMTYADLAKVCVNAMPQGGLDVSQMRDRLNVMNKLEAANGEVKLEDAEANTLKDCVTTMKWATMHKDIVAFVDEIEKL